MRRDRLQEDVSATGFIVLQTAPSALSFQCLSVTGRGLPAENLHKTAVYLLCSNFFLNPWLLHTNCEQSDQSGKLHVMVHTELVTENQHTLPPVPSSNLIHVIF